MGDLPSSEVLAVTNLAVGYGGSPVLRDVSFTIGAGTFLGLLGANGTGKTTLIRAITGQLSIAGRDDIDMQHGLGKVSGGSKDRIWLRSRAK